MTRVQVPAYRCNQCGVDVLADRFPHPALEGWVAFKGATAYRGRVVEETHHCCPSCVKVLT